MITALRFAKYLPHLALLGAVAAFVLLSVENRSLTADLALKEAEITELTGRVSGLTSALENAEARVEAERARRFNTARRSLEGAQDGPVAEVLDRALEALR